MTKRLSIFKKIFSPQTFIIFSFSFLVFHFVSADVPVREQNLEKCDGSKNDDGTCWPVWVHQFDKCTDYQTSLEKFIGGLTLKTSELEYKAQRQAQQRDIQKAREDVNKLVATVYNELKTQQIATEGEGLDINLRNTLQSIGIAVSDTTGDAVKNEEGTDEICKAGYYVKAKVGNEGDQCVAVAQEARFITNQDDYVYEEGRRRAMDMMFCYLGDWRHFPIANTNDPANCEALGLDSSCSTDDIWKTLGEKIHNDPGAYKVNSDTYNTEQHVHNLCEGMRALGLKCSQDKLRDYVKYSTIDKIRRKDRTIILAPPQTWYTPDRCRIIEATLPVTGTPFMDKGKDTPYTKDIKSLTAVNPDKLSIYEFLDYHFGSQFGNPTLPKLPSDMTDAEYTIGAEMQAINVPENGFAGLAAKTEQLADGIIQETTDLRKIQYAAGQGLRDATLRIGWKDYEWDKKDPFLGKYEALDSPIGDPKKPNKIYKPLPCYWEDSAHIEGCESGQGLGLGEPNGKTFYFDTGIVISPISITKSKLDAAIKAQFDLAQKAFSDEGGANSGSQSFGECGISITNPDYSLHSFLPAPWEDTGINLASAINPLTGDSYVTDGLPSKDNISYRIPNLPNNYFNIIYNDVFQLYHTSVPDVFAKWFRINDRIIENPDGTKKEAPTYNSIYGKGEPIDILATEGGTGGDHTFDEDPSPDDPNPPPKGDLPKGCDKFKEQFKGQQGVDACLLEAIAAAESTCDPNQENRRNGNNSCGLMQLEIATAEQLAGRTVTCDELKTDTKLSIKLGAILLKKSQEGIASYGTKHGYDLGAKFTLNGSPDPRDSRFDGGNDDLIASYNGGYGDRIKGNGKKMPFHPSSDCGSNIPSWQCPTNPGGFGKTQRYVQKVQNYQSKCGGA